MRTTTLLERQRVTWRRIARAAAALARSKGHDVGDPVYTTVDGANHEQSLIREQMLNLEVVAAALEALAGIDGQEADQVAEEGAAGEGASDGEKTPAKRTRKKRS